jgi:hypothetical protein
MYRILLLLLLPAIVIVFYREGQKYDPALIEFETLEKSANVSFLPLEIEGYDHTGKVRVFTRDNLYEYVNGHAEYFISAGLVSLMVVEYLGTGSGSLDPDAIVEIYDIGKSIQAFGVLADEAGNGGLESEVGAMSFRSSSGLSFITGNYYVKINAYTDTVPLLEFAKQIEDQIGGKSDFLNFFTRFPNLGKPAATRFIREAYRGLDFLQDVVEREFSPGGNKVQVFMVTGEEDDISKLVSTFLDYFQGSGITYEALEEEGRSFYRVLDPYEGEWILLPLDDLLFGIYGEYETDIVKEFLTR